MNIHLLTQTVDDQKMVSKFSLQIKSEKIRKEFTSQRNRDITWMSMITLISRVGTILFSMIAHLSGL